MLVPVADSRFHRGMGANSRWGWGCVGQHTILQKMSKNRMKLKEFGPPGPPLGIRESLFPICLHSFATCLYIHKHHNNRLLYHVNIYYIRFSDLMKTVLSSYYMLLSRCLWISTTGCETKLIFCKILVSSRFCGEYAR